MQDTQTTLLQNLWRKAWRMQAPLEIPCKTESSAMRMRFALYNCTKNIRSGKQLVDEELQTAAKECSVGFSLEDRSIVVIRLKVQTELMDTVKEILADMPDAAESGEEKAMADSLRTVMEKVGQGPTALQTTPYYVREASKGEGE